MISKPTLKDVANAAGVAVNTASSILNNRSDSWASEETKERVRTAASEIGYRPNQFARGLRLRRYQTIGGIFSDLTNPFYALLVRLLQNTFDKHGYNLIVEETELQLEREIKCLNNLAARQIDALVCSGLDYRKHKKLLDGICRQIPLVAIGGNEALKGVDTVEADFEGGIQSAIAYLTSMRHSRISYINAFDPDKDVSRRTALFQKVLAANELPHTEDSYLDCGYYALAHVRETVKNWVGSFDEKNRPTALICMNDLTAIGAARGILDIGLRIPEDISLIGIDNVELAAYLPFPLTTIAQPVQEMATFCAERLVERIQAKKPMPEVHRVFPTRLIIRKSAGPANL